LRLGGLGFAVLQGLQEEPGRRAGRKESKEERKERRCAQSEPVP